MTEPELDLMDLESSVIDDDDRQKPLTRHRIPLNTEIYVVTNEVKDLKSNKTEFFKQMK